VKKDKPDQPATSDAKASPDVALIHGRTADGEGLRVVRQREQRVELAEVRPLKHGQPIVGEVVTLKPRPHFQLLCDVSVELPRPAAAGAHKGPVQVATDTYRDNWEAVFARPRSELN
jgi:hypothetical protein